MITIGKGEYNELLKKFNEVSKTTLQYAQVLQILKENGVNQIEIPFSRLQDGVMPNLSFEKDEPNRKQIIRW